MRGTPESPGDLQMDVGGEVRKRKRGVCVAVVFSFTSVPSTHTPGGGRGLDGGEMEAALEVEAWVKEMGGGPLGRE